MPRTARPVTQGDINKVCKGVVKAGLKVHRVEVDASTGKIILFTGDPADQPAKSENEWDDMLPNEPAGQ